VGTAVSLVIAMNEMIRRLKEETEASGSTPAEMREALTDRIHEVARTCFFGIDINPDLVKATKMKHGHE